MKKGNNFKNVFKRSAAVLLGAAMVFGSVMIPGNFVENSFIDASAVTLRYIDNNITYGYEFVTINGVKGASLLSAERMFPQSLFEVTPIVVYNGTEYPVIAISEKFLMEDPDITDITFPDSVVRIGYCTLDGSSVENITLPKGLQSIGSDFAARCKNLKSVKYEGNGIDPIYMGADLFEDSELSGITNEKGAVTFGNWLIYYKPDDSIDTLRICDLGTSDIKIDKVARGAFKDPGNIGVLDLEGIKYFGNFTLSKLSKVNTIINDDSVEVIDDVQTINAPWYVNSKENGVIKLGTCLMYYRTDYPVIDLTGEEFKNIKHIKSFSLEDCKKADTLMINSDMDLDFECFYVDHKQQRINDEDANDYLPKIATYKIKNIYLDGKKLVYSSDSPKMNAWITRNFFHLKSTQWLKDIEQAKAKDLFEQLDITFYGLHNDKVGTLSSTEEFYIALKIHDYMSIYDYDHQNENRSGLEAFLTGGKVNCMGYSELTGFLLECAGVDHMSLISESGTHGWDEIKIGDEWFEFDAGWDEQSGHNYKWFGLSSEAAYDMNRTSHKIGSTSSTWHYLKETARVEAQRIIGDLNGDKIRDSKDDYILSHYLEGDEPDIDVVAADINFDGTIDITDCVLLKNFVFGQAVDPDNLPKDGLAPGFKVAFIDGENYENIQYAYTDRDGYIVLPDDTFEAPEGKKLSYDIGMVGQKVKIHDPYMIVRTKWIDASEPDYSEPDSSSSEMSSIPVSSTPDSSISDKSSKPDDSSSIKPESNGILGDVNSDRTIDIEDAVAVIQHINGVTPLKEDEEKRADVSKDHYIDIDDAVMIISYINGSSTF